MKRSLFLKISLAMFLALLLLPSAAPGCEAAGGWSVSVQPGFGFNGDTMTIHVTGIPTQYAYVRIELNNRSIGDGVVSLDSMGKGSYNWTVPIQAETGIYKVTIINNGFNVTNATFSIVFDENTYLRYLIDEVIDEQDRQRTSLGMIGELAQDVKDRLGWILMACVIAATFCVWDTGLMYLKFRDWLDWKLVNRERINGLMGKTQMTFYRLRRPPAEGLMSVEIPEMNRRIDLAKKKIKESNDGKIPKGTHIVMDDPEAPGGFRIYRVKDLPAEEDVEEPRYLDVDEPRGRKGISTRMRERTRKEGFLRGKLNGWKDSRRQKKIDKELEAHHIRMGRLGAVDSESNDLYYDVPEPPKKKQVPRKVPVAVEEIEPEAEDAEDIPEEEEVSEPEPAPVVDAKARARQRVQARRASRVKSEEASQ